MELPPPARTISGVIRGRVVLPMGAAAIDGGWLRIDRGRIVAVGRGRPSEPCLDLGEVILAPGLVNPHCHLEFSDLACPLEAPGGLAGWIPGVVAARRDRPADATAAAIRRGLVESAAAGVTLVGEIASDATGGDPASDLPAMRRYRECLGLGDDAAARGRRAIGEVDRLPDSVLAGLSPHAPYSVSAALGRELIGAARRRGLPVQMHLGESPDEAELLAGGSGPFRSMLESLGAWPSPPPVLLSAAEWIGRLARCSRGAVIHAGFLDDDALARLAGHANRLGVVVCPRTARRLTGRLPPIERLRGAGLRLAVGTDSRASNPDLDPRRDAGELVAAGLVTPAEAVRMITTHAAWMLAMDRVAGRIAPGMPADLAVFAPRRFSDDPHEDLLDTETGLVAAFRRGRRLAVATAGSWR